MNTHPDNSPINSIESLYQQTEVTPCSAYRFPGTPREMYLPAALKVQVDIVDHPRVRSYQHFTGQRHSTFHDTGNPRTKAPAEHAWLKGGRSGAGAGGYQGIVDDLLLIVTGVFDEVTWAQGTERGNLLSWAIELAYGANTDWNHALDNACAVHGGILEMADLPVAQALVQHQFWYGKRCSAQVINRGLVAWVLSRVQYWWEQARAARTGEQPAPQPQKWADAILLVTTSGQPWDGREDQVLNGSKYEAQRVTGTVTVDTLHQRQWASTDSLFTGPGYHWGDEVALLGWVAGELVDGMSEWWVTTEGHRLWAGGIDIAPKQDPDWPVPPETPPGIAAINGRIYYPLHYNGDDPTRQAELGREVTVHRDGNLHRWATTKEVVSPVVGQVVAGDVRLFKYWTRGEPIELDFADGTTGEESVWFAEELLTGARMWSGLSEDRPD